MTKPRFLATLIIFLTAASERSRSGPSGASTGAGASASSFSWTLVAIHRSPIRNGPRLTGFLPGPASLIQNSHIRRVRVPRPSRGRRPNLPTYALRSRLTAPPSLLASGSAVSSFTHKARDLTAGRRSEALDQRFHSFGIGELLLDIDEPRKIRLARLTGERGLRILELLM